MAEWFYRQTAEDPAKGPMPWEELVQLARLGVVSRRTQVRRDDRKWVFAHDVEKLGFAEQLPFDGPSVTEIVCFVLGALMIVGGLLSGLGARHDESPGASFWAALAGIFLCVVGRVVGLLRTLVQTGRDTRASLERIAKLLEAKAADSAPSEPPKPPLISDAPPRLPITR